MLTMRKRVSKLQRKIGKICICICILLPKTTSLLLLGWRLRLLGLLVLLEGYLITGELKLFSRTLSCLGDKRTSNFYLGETLHGVYWLAYIDVEAELFLEVFSFLFIYVLVN